MLALGDTVKVHYTGKYLDGKVFDTTKNKEPILFTIGDEMMIPGFEEAVMEMKAGQKKKVTIAAKDAYGDFDPELVVQVDRKSHFGDKEIKVGDAIQIPASDDVMVFVVKAIDDKNVTLDGNSHLAGKDLIFEIELLEIVQGGGYDTSYSDFESWTGQAIDDEDLEAFMGNGDDPEEGESFDDEFGGSENYSSEYDY
jgi:peptidylprolyl isomerase